MTFLTWIVFMLNSIGLVLCIAGARLISLHGLPPAGSGRKRTHDGMTYLMWGFVIQFFAGLLPIASYLWVLLTSPH